MANTPHASSSAYHHGAPSHQNHASMFAGSHGISIHGGTFNVAGGSIHHNYANARGGVKELLKELPESDHRKIQAENIKRHTHGTVSWLTENKEFLIWVYDEDDQILRIWWGTGIPGAGKTTLAARVIQVIEQHAERTKHVAMAYLFCRYTEKTTMEDLLLALVRQHLENHPQLIDLIEPFWNQHQQRNTSPSRAELIDLLQRISSRFRITFYCLDGLDELPRDDQYALLEALFWLNARIFITSRPLDLVMKALPSLRALFFPVAADRNDIALLATQTIQKDPQFRELLKDHATRNEVISRVCETSGGMFLHAFLLLETLRSCMNERTLREALRTLPSNAENVYTASLARIDAHGVHRARIARQLLTWVTFALRPLTIEDLQHALAICPETEAFDSGLVIKADILLSLSCGLLVQERNTGYVRLIHYTAKDTLQSLLAKDPADPHEMMWKSCSALLLSCNIPQLPATALFSIELHLERTPFLRHAYEQWVHYAKACIHRPDMRQRITRFVQCCTSYPAPKTRVYYWKDIMQPVHVAVWYGLREVVDDLLQSEGDEIVRSFTHRKRSVLTLAAQRSHAEILQTLLGLAPSSSIINATDDDGNTALMHACSVGNPEIVQHLLAVPGGNIGLANNRGANALRLALDSYETAVVSILLNTPGISKFVGISDNYGKTVFHRAIDFERHTNAHGPYFRLFINHPDIGPNFRCTGTLLTPLMIAAIESPIHAEMVLARPDTRVDLLDAEGRTALMHAVANLDANYLVGTIIARPEAEVNVTDALGRTALMRAIRSNSRRAVKVLLDRPDILVNLADLSGQTTLIHAAFTEVYYFQWLLARPDTLVNVVDAEGRTALMHAALNGSADIVDALLADDRIDLTVTDKHGKTVLEMDFGHTLLEQYIRPRLKAAAALKGAVMDS